MGVCVRAASTYVPGMATRRVVTAAARPHVFWVGDQERVRGWPVGRALLETLGEINSHVADALANERARLSDNGYPEDLPLPPLWWTPPARPAVHLVGTTDVAA